MKTSLEIQNLKCGGCANTITKKVSALEDVSELEINNDNNTVAFQHDIEGTINKVQELLNSIGYPVIGDKNAITTKAKSFVSCAIGRMNN